MKMNVETLLQTIGKQTVMIELLQQQLKEAQASEPESNGSGTYHEQADWAKATKAQTPEVR